MCLMRRLYIRKLVREVIGFLKRGFVSLCGSRAMSDDKMQMCESFDFLNEKKRKRENLKILLVT